MASNGFKNLLPRFLGMCHGAERPWIHGATSSSSSPCEYGVAGSMSCMGAALFSAQSRSMAHASSSVWSSPSGAPATSLMTPGRDADRTGRESPNKRGGGTPGRPAVKTKLKSSTPLGASALKTGAALATPSDNKDMEDLISALLQPMPLGKVTHSALADVSVQVNKTLFIDPAKTLESTMRALYVIKQVLQDDGHVYVLNSNPLLQPLLREAALCCVNPNMWFLTEPWVPGSLSTPSSPSSAAPAASAKAGGRRGGPVTGQSSDSPLLFRPEHQPNRQLLAARGLDMINPHCLRQDVLDKPAPKLHPLDKWKLFATSRRQKGGPAMDLLQRALSLENEAARLPLPRMLTGNLSKLRLLVVMDLTHDLPAVDEAYARNVMTVSLVNAHSDLSRITYPVYAGEYHLRFQHFFMDWIIKIANMPPPLKQNS